MLNHWCYSELQFERAIMLPSRTRRGKRRVLLRWCGCVILRARRERPLIREVGRGALKTTGDNLFNRPLCGVDLSGGMLLASGIPRNDITVTFKRLTHCVIVFPRSGDVYRDPCLQTDCRNSVLLHVILPSCPGLTPGARAWLIRVCVPPCTFRVCGFDHQPLPLFE